MSDLSQVFALAWVEWLFTVELLGFSALPLAALLFRAFPDRGYGFSKPLGLLLVAFVNWWLGSTVGFGNYPIVLWIISLALAGGGIALYAAGILARPPDVGALGRILLTEEAIFLVAFVCWTLVRAQNPDIYSTEKPMDFMLLQVSGMSHSFPPPDAWLSGNTVNYYYLGYAIFAMIGKMAVVDPRIGFNLANITIFALGATGAYSIALALTRSLRWAALGIFTVVLAGDLDGIAQVVNQIHNGGLNENGLSLWCSTRIIDGGCNAYHTITEFPIFSLIWNDLHPHVMAIPFVLLAVAFGVHALDDPPALDPSPVGKFIRLAAVALALGALFEINSWDYPAYAAVVVGAMLIALYRAGAPSRLALAETLAVVPASLALYVPYYLTVHSSKRIGIQPNASALGDVLTVIGGLLAPLLFFVVWRSAVALAAASDAPDVTNSGTLVSIIRALPPGSGWWTAYGVLVLLLVWSARTDLLYVLMLAMGLYALLGRRTDEPAVQATLLLMLIAVGVLLAGDFLYLRDVFDNQANYRMNTVFKLYYQAWILLAVATPFAVCFVTRALLARASAPVRWGWYALAFGLATCLAVYPIEGIGSQTRSSALTPTLDGFAYLRDNDPDEYAVISWVRDHTTPTDVVVEAYGGDYWVDAPARSANKMSALTGRPTLISWPGSHEALWRGDFGGGPDASAAGNMLARREADVKTLYTAPDRRTLSRIIQQYHIAYIYVGPYEQATFGVTQRALSLFQSLLTPVVRTPTAVLYRVPGGV